ncbi:MAG: priA, partial [Dehalococcoidia bacterium]|nr:priA [Dehalococcoidia bacterium]
MSQPAGMRYAEVAVNSAGGWRNTFTYSIPNSLAVSIGHAVWVPFGARMLQGVVVGLSDQPAVPQTRDIAGLIAAEPLLSDVQVKLAAWIGLHYLCPPFEAAALMLPPGFERRVLTFVHAGPNLSTESLGVLDDSQREVVSLIQGRDKVELKEVERMVGQRKARTVMQELIRRGVVVKTQELERARVRPKESPHLRLVVSPPEAEEEVKRLRAGRRTASQAALLELLLKEPVPLPISLLRKRLGYSSLPAGALERRGLVMMESLPVIRDPLAGRHYTPSCPPRLYPSQERVWGRLEAGLTAVLGGTSSSKTPVFLLHGVTGSGKTEIYLRALARTVELGKKGIVLVPEIAITPQTIERFASRFPGRVAVLHSGLSLGEQFDEWHRICRGDFDVVIGSRSAIFAPQRELGLIVVDEEHEWTYKQQDRTPRYHAREVAVKLGRICGAVVILGSATPDLESYYRSERGEYELLELPERIAGHRLASLPEVELVDMREELKAGNRSIFSRSLLRGISRVLDAREQAILFLNRRGDATFVQCRRCGFALRCRRCDVSLTYHSVEEGLYCHQCNYRVSVPGLCPQCGSPGMKFLGVGTEGVEREAALAFPGARLLRWDRDVTRGRHFHEEILDKFIRHEADILIGTQMIAKGLDLPLVTLVGVVNADLALNLPDYRSAERTFQLSTQVAGRAGRGTAGGQVVVQTYAPEHYALQAAAGHDYAAFYQRELVGRRQFGQPPFKGLARLLYAHPNAGVCLKE